MPQFIIERHVSGAGTLSAEELADIAARSNAVVAGLGVPYRWITTYVAGDTLYCVHETDHADTILEHARQGGFPADVVTEIAAVIGPSTAAGRGDDQPAQ
ncbi:hypothetical protein Aph02nite_31920 [Actinoplanes philippinensis]|uniref:DUF4242 domain-containing protein n=1 Tax=Actinoplanes philippinensis TaxID=35752 RepID=A0A1I2E6G3_9ACTN|nr:DUF4242 domain-containing protein [Actinoplanes philippinensis]GIE77242.1 hypothetical protein Aph02nite_31920 [Actinoplanes philippinensis]SFE88283.1 Protein of unknown function [Actinoplanes philippinensis]